MPSSHSSVFTKDGREVVIDVPAFHPAYRTFQQPAVGRGVVHPGMLACACGMQRTLLGMIFHGRNGLFSNIGHDPRFPALTDGREFISCPACGRVYHYASVVAASPGGSVPVIVQYVQAGKYRTDYAEYLACSLQAPFRISSQLRPWEGTSLPQGNHSSLAVAHGVQATLTRVPDQCAGLVAYAIALTSDNCPNPITVLVTADPDDPLHDADISEILNEFARNGSNTTLSHLLGPVDAELLMLDMASSVL